jgi:glutathionylspermidine synthase
MERVAVQPRPNWRALVESQGMYFHTDEGELYWDESAYYRFTPEQAQELERATYALNELCVEAVQHIVDHHRELFPRFSIPKELYDYVLQSWERDEFTLYGRFDLAYDGRGVPKLLEYNADTPTALLEAAVVQWFWMKDLQKWHAGELDQFNSIHERLLEAWGQYAPAVQGKLYFTSVRDHVEDYMTVAYLRDTAIQAGLQTEYLPIDDIRWDRKASLFVMGLGKEGSPGYHEVPIYNIFKLYPWEFLVRDQFGGHLPAAPTWWLEAPWKMLLSNKAILPLLHRLHPECPYLLPADFEPLSGSYVKKPTMAREGACVTIVRDGAAIAETDGMDFYRNSPAVYQQYVELPDFDGNHPVIGSWIVNGWACGIGIRESRDLITGNTSRFIPHIVA